MEASGLRADQRRWLLTALLVLALALRVAYALSLDAAEPYTTKSGDSSFYLAHGYTLVTGLSSPVMQVKLSHLGIAPFYLLFNGFWQALLPSETIIGGARLSEGIPVAFSLLNAAPSPAAVVAMRLAQAVLGTATAYFAYRLALLLTRDAVAGLLTAGVIAFTPAFVLESGQITTETVYIFWVTGGLWLYVEAAARPADRRSGLLIGAAALLGLATLTRAVLLLFPLGLALHLLLINRPRWGAALRQAALLLVVYALVVSTWTIYNLARWDRFIIAGEGFSAFLYLGTSGWDNPTQVDQRLEQDVQKAVEDGAAAEDPFLTAAGSRIERDPLGYLRRRVGELAGAYLQPHGTVLFPGASLKALAEDWLTEDRSLGGLLAITRADAFWPKLVLYVVHWGGLIAGLAGMWITRRRWRIALPMIGFIVYVTLVHLVLLALPRYIFPTTVFWWVFGGAAISLIGRRRTPPQLQG